MIIRHAEKPVPSQAHGVDETGSTDRRSLIPRGWQRAGAWAELFQPSLAERKLPRPGVLFASAPTHSIDDEESGSKSRRPLETLTPLAAKLGLRVNLEYSKGQEIALAEAISGIADVVLVCWQHEDIIAIANALTPTPPGLPNQWPGDRFNVLLRFDRSGPPAQWTLKQVTPVMLSGDKTVQI
jgi:hypothetical protein